MKRLDLTITALSPLAIGRQKPGGSVSEAESYIPGIVIRGAIAAQILSHANQQQAGIQSQNLAQNGGDFQALFLGEQPAIFCNAYPAIARVSKTRSEYVAEPVWVLPVTAVSSKTEPGFRLEEDHNKERSDQKPGVFDTLIDRFCAEAHHHSYDPSCPKDNSRVEPFGGFYSKTKDTKAKHPYRSHAISTRFLTRVGINRRRATAQDEVLYSIEVLNETFLRDSKAKFPKWEYTAYRGAILIPDETLADSLCRFINNNVTHFRIGGSASRGLGKVKLEAECSSFPDIPSRIHTFNQALQSRWHLWSQLLGEPAINEAADRLFFTINLQADTILTENWRRTTVISEAMLRKIVEIEDDTLKLHVAYSSHDYRSGWNAAWGLMKDMELVINKGGVYLFSVDRSRQAEWTEKLTSLETKGVGDRTCEGFGQIQVCNEFHTVFRENPA